MFQEEFFNTTFVDNYVNVAKQKVLSYVKQMSEDEFLKYDDDTLVNYFFNKINFVPLELCNVENPNITIDKKIDTERERNGWYDLGVPNQREFYEVDVENLYFTYNIVLSGNTELAYLRPLQYVGIDPETYKNLKIIHKQDENIDILQVNIKIPINSVNEETIQSKMNQLYHNNLKLFMHNLQNVNQEILKYSNSMKSYIKDLVQGRRANYNKYSKICEQFNVSLKSNELIKFAQPLKLHKKDNSLPNLPTNQNVSYVISDKDIFDINNLIYCYCSTMERMPYTYINNGEEDIRNTILAALNTQYSNATGETFSNKGKTDLFIGIYGKSAYIAECKIWKGKKVFFEAIKQLLGYVTYKECKGTLIFFNKTNKNFNALLQEIPEIIKNHEKFVDIKKIDENRFDFTVKKDDGTLFPILLMIFNFYCEK